jgi:hypothetical protein
MLIKTLIISVIIIAIIMLALGVKLIFDPKAEFSLHSCALEDGITDKDGACAKCQLKDLADCPESKRDKTAK